MPKLGSNNPFPTVRFAQQASNPATPDTDEWRLFFKDGGLYFIDDAGTVTKVDTALEHFAIPVACSDEDTAIDATGTKVTFRMPFAATLTGVRASLTSACATGTFTVDVNEGGASILSTKLTIDATETTSTTAAAAPVISDASLADDAEITIDVDDVGDGAATGLKVTLVGTRTP